MGVIIKTGGRNLAAKIGSFFVVGLTISEAPARWRLPLVFWFSISSPIFYLNPDSCTKFLDTFLCIADAAQPTAEATSVPGPDASGSVRILCRSLRPIAAAAGSSSCPHSHHCFSVQRSPDQGRVCLGQPTAAATASAADSFVQDQLLPSADTTSARLPA